MLSPTDSLVRETHAAVTPHVLVRVVRDALLVPPGAAGPPRAEQLDEVVELVLLGVAPRPNPRP
jgi:hypothetical protein